MLGNNQDLIPSLEGIKEAVLQLTGQNDGFIEIGRSTLPSAADTISVSFTAFKYLRVYFFMIATGGVIDTNLTFNGDSAANYNFNGFSNAAAITSAVSQNYIPMESGTTVSGTSSLFVMDILNYQTQEKLCWTSSVNNQGTGAATLPRFLLAAQKWANTTSQITSITLTNVGAGDLAANSEILVFGKD